MKISELVQSEGWIKFSKRLELISASFFAITIIMLVAGYTENNLYRQILTMTLGFFAILSYFIGFNNFNSESKIISFIFYKIYGYGLSITFLTSIFIYLDFKFPKEIVIITSVVMLSTSTLLGIKEKMSENINNINWLYFIRIIIAVTTFLYMITLKR